MAQTVHAEDTAAEQGQTPEKKSGTVTLEKKNDGTYVFGNEYLKRTFSLSADKVLSTKEITNYRTGTPTVFTPQAGSEEFIINTLDNNSEGEDSGFVAPKKKLETTYVPSFFFSRVTVPLFFSGVCPCSAAVSSA